MPTTAVLYRWFDSDGQILYIGVTTDLGRRTDRHAARAPWWRHAARCEGVVYPTRAEAEHAERLAILAERPPFNQTASEAVPAQQRTRRVGRGKCDLCGRTLPPPGAATGRPPKRHAECQAEFRRAYDREKKRQRRAK